MQMTQKPLSKEETRERDLKDELRTSLMHKLTDAGHALSVLKETNLLGKETAYRVTIDYTPSSNDMHLAVICNHTGYLEDAVKMTLDQFNEIGKKSCPDALIFRGCSAEILIGGVLLILPYDLWTDKAQDIISHLRYLQRVDH